LRIALFTDTYVPTVNGVARTLAQLVDQAGSRGHEVALFSTRVSDGPAAGTVMHHQVAGIPAPVYPELQLARPLERSGRRKLERFEPEVVHAATESTVGWSGRRWAVRKRVPLVTSFHTNFPEYTRGYGLGWFENAVWRYLRWFHEGARISFCPSRATLEDLQERGFHSRWRVWSRGVDSELFSPSRRNPDVRAELAPGADTILLYVGRLAPEKRCEIAIQAFDRIRSDFPGAALVFVGDGPFRPQLEAMRVPHVHFAGYRTGIPLAEAYAAGDLFVFPSDTETFGNVVNEALASGLPVVAANRGGVRDIVVPGRTGILCAPRDPGSFAEGLRALLTDSDLRARLAAGARASAATRTWTRIFDVLFDGYEEALGGGTVPAGRTA
jgi:glycosyltransferase involved in cell wall biosynthesis